MSAPPASSTRLQVALGGAAGALVRVALVAAVVGATDASAERLAVIALNLLGAGALAWLVARARHDERWARRVPLLGVGLLGAVTTFSTLAAQLAASVRADRLGEAGALAVASLLGGLAAVRIGWWAAGRGAAEVTAP